MSERSDHTQYAQRALVGLADVLRQRRLALGLTQAQAGALVGISGKTIAGLEAHVPALRLSKVLEYAHALGLDGGQLFPPDPALPLTQVLAALQGLPPPWTEAVLTCLRLARTRPPRA